jgi:hypothetical protein
MTAGPDGIDDPGIDHCRGITFALQLKFLAIDTARDIRCKNQQQVDRLGRTDRRQ